MKRSLNRPGPALLCLLPLAAAAQSSDQDELALAYGDRSFVTIATGTKVVAPRAPAVATVITAEDIAATGATTLDEVLETVPGLHVARGTQAGTSVYVIRGVHRDLNPQVLVLVNGIPMTTAFEENRGDVSSGIRLENVARIEVIRGPGSALYGADAMTGVINVTTKSAADIAGTEIGVRAGEFGSVQGWALHGGRLGTLEVAGYLSVGSTDGWERTVRADAQTGLDSLLGTHASKAPGPIDADFGNIDGALDLTYGAWQLRTAYRAHDDMGSFWGVASALAPGDHNRSEQVTADLTYHKTNFRPDWDVSVQASYMYLDVQSDLTLFPAGTNLGGGTFVDGMIGNPYKWEQHFRGNVQAGYNGFEHHHVRVGVGATDDDLYKIRETKNFLPGVLPFTPYGTGSVADVVDVSATAPYLRPHDRMDVWWFVQDEWTFAPDWTLTAGVRRDEYSDFGDTTNPRVALAWDVTYNLTAKLMYGTAFRAPSFVELYTSNNPVQVGTPNLQPETMETTEGALSWQATPALHFGVNAFRYRMDHIIQIVGTTFRNGGEQTGEGLEAEAAWDATRTLRFAGNYSFQHSIDEASGELAGLAPMHHGYLRADWRFLPQWAGDVQVNVVGTRERAPGDTRDALDGYTAVDFTVRSERGRKGWNVKCSLRNLFDADVREPSPFDMTPGHPFISLPYDFPLAGRSFYVQGSYAF
ncbi:MAG: TonB-dependent receptor [Gammaproteobacteria bacterium]|nr:TonB-dependent receptor [Gammaproteobacteria bacterium]